MKYILSNLDQVCPLVYRGIANQGFTRYMPIWDFEKSFNTFNFHKVKDMVPSGIFRHPLPLFKTAIP